MKPDVEIHRGQLFGIAYRMLGSVADAEDIVQDAFLRWETYPDWAQVESPKAWLVTAVTRLCIDMLRSARHLREQYVGIYLPEPLVEGPGNTPDREAALSDSLSTAFLLMLETLSPAERAVFLLREGFGYDYDEIAQTVGKSAANCRQIVTRSKERLADRRTRFLAAPSDSESLVKTFFAASATGDVSQILATLATNATMYSDGGGRVKAAGRPIIGADNIARFLVGIRRFGTMPTDVRFARVNGTAGALIFEDGRLTQTASFEIRDGRIEAISIMRNPDKLIHLADLDRAPDDIG
jgi:RNA polymerase sigma-70 factor (ECF subfamily)